jgi:hypothetical protein
MIRFIVKSTILTLALITASAVLAADHGWVMGMEHPNHEDNVYTVNISWVDGHNTGFGVEKQVKAGEHEITVNLVMEPAWTPHLDVARNNTYSQTFKLQVEAGTVYVIGAKVDPEASADAQRDGSFWYPVIVDKNQR